MTEKRPRGRPKGWRPPRQAEERFKNDAPRSQGKLHVPTPTSRGLVRMAILRGERLEDIAAASGIDHKTLTKHYGEEIRGARHSVAGALLQTAIMIGMGGSGGPDDWRNANADMLKWLLARLFGVVEKQKPQEHHHSGAIGNYDLDKMSKDDLIALRNLLAPVAVVGDDRRGDSEEGR